MNRYLYLRAYMAGVVVPTVLLLVGASAFIVAGLMYHDLAQLERVLIFPLIIVPNAFGLWNMLYVAQRPRWHVPIGLHGAALPFILAPINFALASSLGFLQITGARVTWFDIVSLPTWFLGIAPFIAVTAYYLIWKYLVGFLNRVQGIE
jgi:hypothetical protein